jgi:radical SAM protein with 4Fe4S-binding SPASM domain
MWFSASAFFSNVLQYRKSLTIARSINLLKLFAGFFASRIKGFPVLRAYPFAISVEPSGYCQLQCPECPTGAAVLSRPKGTMRLDLYNKLIDNLSKYTFYLNLYFQGEPLLNPAITPMIKRASEKNIYTAISTNGLLLTKTIGRQIAASGLSRIIISLDGFTQPVYEKYRKGGQVETVKNGILNLIEARNATRVQTPLIAVQFLAFRHNMHELPQIKEWCRQAGVDKLEIKTAQINNFGDKSVEAPASKTRYTLRPDDKLKIKGKAYNHCWRLMNSTVISWDGKMAPCCYDKNLNHSFGNISLSSASNVWKNQIANDFRKSILINRSSIEMCQNCPEGRSFII